MEWRSVACPFSLRRKTDGTAPPIIALPRNQSQRKVAEVGLKWVGDQEFAGIDAVITTLVQYGGSAGV
jgi:hypothetical protein